MKKNHTGSTAEIVNKDGVELIAEATGEVEYNDAR